MHHALGRALTPIVFLFLFLVIGSARPFERVPQGEEVYNDLATLADAGLFTDYSLPTGELSRLEAAVLVRHALSEYGETLASGNSETLKIEEAFTRLLVSFEEELAQLGTAPALIPANSTSIRNLAALESRIEYLEEEVEDNGEPESLVYDDQFYRRWYASEEMELSCDEGEEGEGVEVSLYGDFYIQGQAFQTDVEVDAVTEATNFNDIDIYYGELGVEAICGDWMGHLSFNLDDDGDDVALYQAFARYDNPCNDMFFLAGRHELPFGNNDFYFPTYPAANDLAVTRVNTIGLGYDAPCFGLSGWVFNPDVDLADEEDTLSDYAFVVDLTKQEADECQDGWRVSASYTSHLATHDLRLADDGPVATRVAAYNVFGRYDFRGNRFHILADYTAALDEFDPGDLDIDADGVGDQPTALNVEFVYEPCPDNLWGVSYQLTDEYTDYAETRYGLLYGQRLNEIAMLKLEYTHGEYGDFVTGGQLTDDTFVAELNIAF